MDDRTRTALEASIRHWQRNLAAESLSDVYTGGDACALCAEFVKIEDDEGLLCTGCPVRERTGETLCVGTPYALAYKAMMEWEWAKSHGHRARRRDEFRAAAQREVDFLRSLLPTTGEEP